MREDAHAELEPADFEVTIGRVQEMVLPEIDGLAIGWGKSICDVLQTAPPARLLVAWRRLL